MTYCLAVTVDAGLVFASDSRTNAGVDQIATFSKMHRFLGNGERYFVLLSSGNLATTQAVVTQLKRDIEKEADRSLATVEHLSEAAEYVGEINREEQKKHSSDRKEGFKPDASFILGGEIAGRPPSIFHVYPEGNFIRAAERTPFLQIGELKYGKPILDRIISADMDLEDVARCAIVSMDSTMRSNVTVGPPIEVLIYRSGTMEAGRHIVLGEDDEYLRTLRTAWQESMRSAFNELPKLPRLTASVRLVDEQR